MYLTDEVQVLYLIKHIQGINRWKQVVDIFVYWEYFPCDSENALFCIHVLDREISHGLFFVLLQRCLPQTWKTYDSPCSDVTVRSDKSRLDEHNAADAELLWCWADVYGAIFTYPHCCPGWYSCHCQYGRVPTINNPSLEISPAWREHLTIILEIVHSIRVFQWKQLLLLVGSWLV